jgi:hypothetical protein
MKAVTREEVNAAALNREFPDFVIESFNECIVASKLKNSTTVKQDDVMDLICAKSGETRQKVFDNHWLDVEQYYRNAGWIVTYDKPAYNESYKAYFTFK